MATKKKRRDYVESSRGGGPRPAFARQLRNGTDTAWIWHARSESEGEKCE